MKLRFDDLGNIEGSDDYRTPLNPDVPLFSEEDDDDDDYATFEAFDATDTYEDFILERNVVTVSLSLGAFGSVEA